ncbi:MAG: acyl-ACP--UDP-N-acetylglucosamine O-acyltransferase [Pseudomonadota bacterium]
MSEPRAPFDNEIIAPGIDPRAIVHERAVLGERVTVGPWSIIGPGVEIGDDSWVGPHVVIKGPTRIGRGNRIFQFATVGDDTPALAFGGEETWLIVGDHNVIREGVTIHRGTAQDASKTIIGNHCLLMAYVHVGHDCVLGDHVIMANNAGVAGHVSVGDHANFGGFAAVPQYRRVGAFTHIAGMSLVLKDVPAYMTVSGNPASAIGLNLEGLRRRGYDSTRIDALKAAHKIVYREGRTTKDALGALESLAAEDEAVQRFRDSIVDSKLGIIRPRS